MTNINGIIILDKPSNYDSHQVTGLIKRMLNIDKIGHSGTLDPKVTGVLIIFLGHSTRLAAHLFGKDKEYVGIMRLHGNVSIKKLVDVIKRKFIGKIKQLPPVKSAVKREERIREIYDFKVLEKEGNDFLFEVCCEKGTYVRKLIHDLGVELGIGAHMLELRRTREGHFSEKDSVTVYDIEKAIKENNLDKIILTPEAIIGNMPKVTAKDEYLEKLYNGVPVMKYFVKSSKRKLKKGSVIAITSENNKLIEIAEVVDEGDILAKPKTVIKDGISSNN